MAIKCKTINGITSKTPQNLMLNAGAFYKNFDIATDTYDTAEDKLLGATKGGGNFSAVPEFRTVEVDGARGKVMGMEILDSWECKLGANLLEVTKENIMAGLGLAVEGESENPKYDKLQAKGCATLDDYIDNITWIGTLSGSDEPVIIQLYNALNTKGIELGMEDKNEGVLPLEFEGFYSMDDTSTPPFAIYYPKQGA